MTPRAQWSRPCDDAGFQRGRRASEDCLAGHSRVGSVTATPVDVGRLAFTVVCTEPASELVRTKVTRPPLDPTIQPTHAGQRPCIAAHASARAPKPQSALPTATGR